MSLIYCRMLTVLCIILALVLHSSCYDYHLSKTITLDNFIQVNNVQTLTADTVAVMEGNLSKLTITALRGDHLQEQVYKVTEFDLVSEPKFNGTANLIINKGNNIYAKYYQEQMLITFRKIQSNKVLNMYKNVIFSQAQKCPTLTTVSYNDLRSRSIGNQTECNFYSRGYLSIYQGQYLAYAAKQQILFLNVFNNYEILATFTEPTLSPFSYVDTFYDKDAKDVTAIGSYPAQLAGTYRMIRKQDGSSQVTYSPFFFNPTSKLTLTSRHEAVSIYGDRLYKWQNLDNLTLNIVWSDVSQSLEGTFPSALSYNQSLIVQTSANTLHVYQIDDLTFNLTQLYSVNITGVVSVVKGRITKDGNYYIFNAVKINGFFVLCQFSLINQTLLCLNETRFLGNGPQPVEIQIIRDGVSAKPKASQEQKQLKKTSQYIKATGTIDGRLTFTYYNEQQLQSSDGLDHTYDCQQWTLYSQSDKIVALCKNISSQLVQLHCYQASTMNLLFADDIYVQDIPDISAVLLLPNQYKEQNDPSIQDRPMFMLVFKQHNVDVDSDVAVSYRYTVQSDFFLRDTAVFKEVSFWNSYVYGGYIASLQFNTDVSKSNQLKIFNSTSGSLIKTVTFEQTVSFLSYVIVGYRNILQVHHILGLQPTYFYDLKKRPADQYWFRGAYFYNYFRYGSVADGGQYIIFPKKQIQLYYRYDKTRTTQPLKQIFSISKAPVLSSQRMSSEHPIPQVQASLYLKSDINVDWRDCDMVAYISNNRWLNIYRLCDQSIAKYDVNPNNNGNFINWRLEQSGTKESIQIIYDSVVINAVYQVVQVRKFGNPSQIVWKYSKILSTQLIQFVNYYQNVYGSYANVAYTSDFIIKTIQQTMNSSYLQMISVDQLDLQPKCSAYAGQSQQSAGVNGIIWYQSLTQINDIFKVHENSLIEQLRMWGMEIVSDSTTILRLDQDCSKLAIFSHKGSLLVWNISDPNSAPHLQFNWTIDPTQVRDFKFAGVNKIIVQKTNGVQIYNVTIADDELNRIPFKIEALNSKSATSSDGNLYAIANNPLQVQIKTTLGQSVRTFKVPNDASTKDQQITSLSFNSISHQLLVSVSNSKIYVLDPTNCSDPFINIDAVCLCRQNQTVSANTCVCQNHYIHPTNDTQNVCICDTSKFVYENNLCVCSANSSQVNNQCVCHQNFVKQGVHCLCAEPFTYNSDKLLCECHNGYVQNNKCLSCIFPCQTCTMGGQSCITYQPLFYVLVIGGPILLIIIIVIVVIIIKKKTAVPENQLLKDDDKQ